MFPGLLVERNDEIVNGVLVFEGVPKGPAVDDPIAITAPDSFALEIPLVLEFVDDALNRSDGEADCVGNVSLAELGVSTEGDQDVRMVGEKRP